jgi:hypothetical protein
MFICVIQSYKGQGLEEAVTSSGVQYLHRLVALLLGILGILEVTSKTQRGEGILAGYT